MGAPEISCVCCGDTDGPFDDPGPDALCEACLRTVPKERAA